MLYSVVLTLICLVSLVLGLRGLGNSSKNLDAIRGAIEGSISSPLLKTSWIWFVFLVSFFLLPFFWGLTLFIKTDANVVVIIFGIVWIYFWSRTLILFR
ncbi:hypothetical protein EHQ53_08470 [Leptospira langatensis]|uniref:Uncharacterized protein n=1 Tax=Leptospira langatensis TaxID=2484983 RepID=A0A5F1ZUS7_9LEPT|nr:hypothetical protein [Leptospira langatensis]TGK01335.1 hypothetical protein EHO57_10400 [Leptospira langatensis]TGL42213.1 hypothetical protein EHQ53_08470 [Leptospira langatensis]